MGVQHYFILFFHDFVQNLRTTMRASEYYDKHRREKGPSFQICTDKTIMHYGQLHIQFELSKRIMHDA